MDPKRRLGRHGTAVVLASTCAAASAVLVTEPPAAATASPPAATASAVVMATGDLTYQGCVKDAGTGATCSAENLGLSTAHAVAVSPDGKSVYATGLGDDAVSIFDRDPATGALTPDGCISDVLVTVSPCSDVQEGLNDPFGLAVSPDGLDVYVAGRDDDAVVHLERNTTNGDLTPGGCIAYTGDIAGCGGTTQPGLLEPRSLVVSSDGLSVLVAGGNSANGSVVQLGRSTSGGNLTPGACVSETNDTTGCGTTHAGLDEAYDIAISSDGASVHVVTRNSNSLVSLSSGSLSSLGCWSDSDAPVAGCATTQGLASNRGVAVSPDDKSVYVASAGDSALTHFSRAPDGGLNSPGCVGDAGTTGCAVTQQGLGGASDVAIPPDNSSVYVVGDEDTIVTFDRNTTTAALTSRGCISQTPDTPGCGTGVEGLADGRGVAISSDSGSVYVASLGRQAVTRFDRTASPDAPPVPPNAVTFRTGKTACKHPCKNVKVKIRTPEDTSGRIYVCMYPGKFSNCPLGPRRATEMDKKAPKLIKPKALDVSGGTTRIKLKTTRKARSILTEKGRLKIKLQVDYRPDGGTIGSDVRRIKVELKG